jgi:hypothetical protein
MPQSSYYNQYDANREAHQGYQNILKQLGGFAYYAIRFFFNFLASMFKMVAGK